MYSRDEILKIMLPDELYHQVAAILRDKDVYKRFGVNISDLEDYMSLTINHDGSLHKTSNNKPLLEDLQVGRNLHLNNSIDSYCLFSKPIAINYTEYLISIRLDTTVVTCEFDGRNWAVKLSFCNYDCNIIGENYILAIFRGSKDINIIQTKDCIKKNIYIKYKENSDIELDIGGVGIITIDITNPNWPIIDKLIESIREFASETEVYRLISFINTMLVNNGEVKLK